MSYVALYRKFRPTVFEEVKGQEGIVTTLKNQIKSNRIGHAYLFCGTRGTGKTTIAKIFAKAANCENPQDGSPCGECEICRKIAAGTGMNVIEIDAASNNGVDNIREIVEEVNYSPAEGKYKVYIIDEVHMLSTGAFNALLKTLEEPPSYVIFILATTESHKIPITILSRCQRYDFKRIGMDTIGDRIRELVAAESVDIEDAAINHIAKVADGSMRDALSLLDQCIAFHYNEKLTYEKVLNVLGSVDTGVFADLLECVIDKNITGAIGILDEIVVQGRDLTQFVTDFTWYLRNLMLAKSSEVSPDTLEISAEALARMKKEAERVELNTIFRYIRIFSELAGNMRYASQKRIMIEVAIIKLCKPQMETGMDSLLERIRDIENQLASGVVAVSPAAVSGGGEFPVQAQSKPKVQLPKALPEDIHIVMKNWSAIKDMMDQPFKSYLQDVYLSIDGETLLLVAESFLAESYLNNPEYFDKLKQEMDDCVGKEISVRVVSQKKDDPGELFPNIEKKFGEKIEIDDGPIW